MTINWTLPVETTENPPRPVRVLATDRVGICPIVIMFNNGDIVSVPLNGCGANGLRLRNVAPPKQEPVLREVWANLYADAGTQIFGTEKSARENAYSNRVECRRIAWMSDGSPVPSEASGEDTGCGLLRHVDDDGREDGHTLTMVSGGADYIGDFDTGFPRSLELCRMHDHNKTMAYVAETDRDHWKAKAEALQAEVNAMRPVVAAAKAWDWCNSATRRNTLQSAIRTFLRQQATKLVKNCTTCRHQVGVGCYPCTRYNKWEPRHD